MKKSIVLVLVVLILFSCTACNADGKKNIEPRLDQMKAICELSTMNCFYHTVAKYNAEDDKQFLWWKWGGKHFWVEYSGVVTLGIDTSLVSMDIIGDVVTVTIPSATVQGCKVDSASLTEDSYIVDKDSAEIKAEDEINAFNMAQQELREQASNNKALLNQAQDRAKLLIEGYIKNIGAAVGKEYTIVWKSIDPSADTTEEI